MLFSLFSVVFLTAKVAFGAPSIASAHKIAIPVGGSASFVCATETIAIWTKEEYDGTHKSIAAGEVALPGVDSSRRFLASFRLYFVIKYINTASSTRLDSSVTDADADGQRPSTPISASFRSFYA